MSEDRLLFQWDLEGENKKPTPTHLLAQEKLITYSLINSTFQTSFYLYTDYLKAYTVC